MIGEAIIGSVTLIVLGGLWLTDRVMTKTVRARTTPSDDARLRALSKQRDHWAAVLRESPYEADRSAATAELKRIDREMLR